MGAWVRSRRGHWVGAFFLFLSLLSAFGQPLSPGDILFLGYRTDDPDAFAFVPLVNLDPLTEIVFTDNVWKGGALLSNETTGVWQAPESGVAAGSVVQIEGHQVAAGGGVWIGSALALSTDGEQILAYQGPPAAPVFIAAISTRQWAAQESEVHNGLSELPPGLALGESAVTFGFHRDNAMYRFGLTAGSPSALRAAVNNQAAWVRSDRPLTSSMRPLEVRLPLAALPLGSIAFAAYGMDEKRVAFVALRDLPARTEIIFSDIGYNGLNLVPAHGLEEHTVVWQAPANPVPAGTVIELRAGRASMGLVSGELLDLSVAGEQILAFQGSVTSPSFLAGVSSRHWKGALPIDKTQSLLPPALTLGLSAVGFSSQDVDNGYFGGIISLEDPVAMQQRLCEAPQWTRSNTPQSWPVGWGFKPEPGTLFRMQ